MSSTIGICFLWVLQNAVKDKTTSSTSRSLKRNFNLNYLIISLKRGASKQIAYYLLAFCLSLFCAYFVTFCGAVISSSLNTNKLITEIHLEDGSTDTICILAIYNDNNAVGIKTDDVSDGIYRATIPHNGNFYYFSLTDVDQIYERRCKISGTQELNEFEIIFGFLFGPN